MPGSRNEHYFHAPIQGFQESKLILPSLYMPRFSTLKGLLSPAECCALVKPSQMVCEFALRKNLVKKTINCDLYTAVAQRGKWSRKPLWLCKTSSPINCRPKDGQLVWDMVLLRLNLQNWLRLRWSAKVNKVRAKWQSLPNHDSQQGSQTTSKLIRDVERQSSYRDRTCQLTDHQIGSLKGHHCTEWVVISELNDVGDVSTYVSTKLIPPPVYAATTWLIGKRGINRRRGHPWQVRTIL